MKGNVMPSTLRLSHVALAALAFLCSAVGCTQLDLVQPTAWFSGDDEPQTPAKVVAVWTDAEAQHVDHRRTRGFGGRLTFYQRDSDAPVRVDGALVVYTFDEEGRNPRNTMPNRKYVFTPEQFAGHHSKSKLGHSYSVWIPWDEAGGPKKEVGLICRFEPTDGPPIIGEQTQVTLRGSAPFAMAQGAEPASYIERVGSPNSRILPVTHHETSADGGAAIGEEADGEEKMKTTTIPISSRFGRRMPVAQTRARATRALARERQSREIGILKAEAEGTTTGPPADQTATATARLPSVDSPPGSLRAPVGQSARQAYGRAPWQPPPAGSPYPSRPLPPRASAPGSNSTSQTVQPSGNRVEPARVGPR
jgi:hypothetical protein